MDTQALREEHRLIVTLASRLAGVAGDIKTRGDAHDASALIRSIDELLRGHLADEDQNLYPAFLAAEDEETRWMGAEASEDMGGIIGAWINYRDRWALEAILREGSCFAAATRGVLGALSLRIEMENDVLYPAAEGLTGATERSAA